MDTTVSQLNSIAASVSEDAQSMRAREQRVRALKDKVNEGSFSDAVKESLNAKIDAIADGVGNVASQQEQIAARLNTAAADLSSGAANAEKSHQEVKDLIAQAKDSLATVQSDYDSTLKGQIESLSSSASNIANASSDIASSLDATMTELGGATASLAGDLTKVGGVMQDAAGTLGQAADDLQQLKDKLDTAVSSGDVEQIRSLIGSDPQALAEALAAPVALDRQAVYPIKNYGSAMAPFYTVLSLWVAASCWRPCSRRAWTTRACASWPRCACTSCIWGVSRYSRCWLCARQRWCAPATCCSSRFNVRTPGSSCWWAG